MVKQIKNTWTNIHDLDKLYKNILNSLWIYMDLHIRIFYMNFQNTIYEITIKQNLYSGFKNLKNTQKEIKIIILLQNW